MDSFAVIALHLAKKFVGILFRRKAVLSNYGATDFFTDWNGISPPATKLRLRHTDGNTKTSEIRLTGTAARRATTQPPSRMTLDPTVIEENRSIRITLA